MTSTVVVTRLPALDFSRDYVALPADYGRPAYEARPDVQAIRSALAETLLTLDQYAPFLEGLRGRKVVIKPNLVTVYHQMGTVADDYPESSDPRLLDALVCFLQRYTRQIVIVESSGRGVPTRGSFRVAGLLRLAKQRGVELQALEEQPVERFLLPKAQVMKEVYVPRIFGEIARHEAFYISLPKLKTNLYTGVTLGFKNGMGVIPYNLRLRNHNHALAEKLVDLLYLFRPDLVLIDGIIGGEGNCPAPVDPVPSHLLVCGNHSVETDRVATQLMGFNPASIPLMQIADQRGFADPQVQIIGDLRPVPFRPADPSLTGTWMAEHFPNVRVLTAENAQGRLPCRGGCLATTRFAFEMLVREGLPTNFSLTLLLGGNPHNIYHDQQGNTYTLEQIRALPGKKLAIGNCTSALRSLARHVPGCMPFPNSPHMALHQLTGSLCRVMSLRNRFLLPLLWDTLASCEARKRLLRQGLPLDVSKPQDDARHLIRPLTEEEQRLDFIAEPLPQLSKAQIRQLCADENRAVLSIFLSD